ncbi:toll-like receptor 4 [Saccostrea echinata]|uniref:toll-like receptor 4 n=1 Tax=Saccostrea echinata TaxID=191078 RepID=UPI002A7F6A67|nr:toll-like receptor 4 [Saccostrea echinata]
MNLKGNINPMDHILIRDDAFSELIALKMLKIDGPRNITFGEGFLKLTDMNILDLSGITGHCSFQKIWQGFFKYLPNLTYIDVSACEILHVYDGAFGSLPFLKHLDISHNNRLGFASLPNITKNLDKTAIEIFRFNGINCLTGTGTKIRTCHLINLKDTKITELYIEKNRLEQFEAGAIKVLPKTLKKVSLGENKLTQGKYMIDYFSVESVRIFNISVQLRPAPFPWSIFENCIEKHDDCEFSFSENDRRTDAERSTDILFRTNDKGLITFNIPRSAEIIYANSSRLYTAIPEFGLNSKGFREFYLQDNFFYSWIGPVHGIENLTIIDLSNNFCSNISQFFFKYATGIQILNLSKNDIVEIDSLPGILLTILKQNSYLEYPKEECAYDVFWEKFQSLIEQDVMSDMEHEIKPTIMQDNLSDIEKDFVCDTEPLITPDIEQG